MNVEELRRRGILGGGNRRSARHYGPPLATRYNKRVRAHVEENTPGASSGTTGIGSLLGGIAGGYAGGGNPGAAAIGATVGDLGEQVIPYIPQMVKRVKSWFSGMGDYKLNTNSLIEGGGVTDSNIQIVPQGNRAIRIIYREYLGDVITGPVAGAFSIRGFALNPGLVELCPWLAPIAQQYEQWSPNGMVFEFRSTSSDYTATQALGSVIMATEYDSFDKPFANKQEMLNCAYSSEAKPTDRLLHGVECDPRDNPNSIFYVRSGTNPSGASLRESDLGIFYVATQGGSTANLNLGSLYVHYDITLRKEQLFNGLPARGLLFDAIWGVAGVATATPLPTIASGNVRTVASTPLMTIGGLGTSITLPPWVNNGRWRLIYYYSTTGNATQLMPPVITPLVNCFPVVSTPLTNGGDAVQLRNIRIPGFTATSCVAYIDFNVTGPSPSLLAAGAIIDLGAAVPDKCFIAIQQMGEAW